MKKLGYDQETYDLMKELGLNPETDKPVLMQKVYLDGSSVVFFPDGSGDARVVEVDEPGSAREFTNEFEEDSPFAMGMEFDDCSSTGSMNFSKEACGKILGRLYFTIGNHHGFDEAKRMFGSYAKNTPAVLKPKQLDLLRRYSEMKPPNIAKLARKILSENKKMGRGSTDLENINRNISRVINNARRKFGFMVVLPPKG